MSKSPKVVSVVSLGLATVAMAFLPGCSDDSQGGVVGVGNNPVVEATQQEDPKRASYAVLTSPEEPEDTPDAEPLMDYFEHEFSGGFTVRYITTVEGASTYLAGGDDSLCLGFVEEGFVSASCGDWLGVQDTWVAASGSSPEHAPYLMVLAPDGYTVGRIGDSECPIHSNLFIVINPALREPVTLSGDGLEEISFDGQEVALPEDLRGTESNDCFS